MLCSGTAIRRGGAFFMAVALSFAVAACGFRPLYGARQSDPAVAQQLSEIAVGAPQTRLGRTLQFNLEDRLGTQSSRRQYRLDLRPSLSVRNVAVRQDTEVTRRNLILTARFSLIDLNTGKVVFASRSRTTTSYNRVESEFANVIAREGAERRATEAVAEDIKLQLGIFFDRQASS